MESIHKVLSLQEILPNYQPANELGMTQGKMGQLFLCYELKTTILPKKASFLSFRALTTGARGKKRGVRRLDLTPFAPLSWGRSSGGLHQSRLHNQP